MRPVEKEIWHNSSEATITIISGAPSPNCSSLPVKKAIKVTTGTVSELTESGFLLTTETDVVQVNADAALLDGMENGMTVTVYSNGAMTMSLPGQIGAEKIVKAE